MQDLLKTSVIQACLPSTEITATVNPAAAVTHSSYQSRMCQEKAHRSRRRGNKPCYMAGCASPKLALGVIAGWRHPSCL